MPLGVLFILLAAVLWGITGPIATLAFREGLHPLEVAFWRATIGGLLFGAHALARGRWRLVRRDVPAVVAFGLVGVSLFYGVYQLAIRSAGAALAAVLLYTAPVWVAILSHLVLRERVGRREGVAIAVTVAGVALVSLPTGDAAVNLGGVAAGLLSGLAYALYFLFGKRYGPRYETPTLFLWLLPVGALGLLPFVPFAAKTATAWGALVALGTLTTYGAYLAYFAGLKRLPATRAAVVCTLEPVIAAALAHAVWGERFGVLGYVGSTLVLAAVLLVLAPNSPPVPGSACDTGPSAASAAPNRSST